MKTYVGNSATERRSLLSVLWVFLSVNYIMCDVLSNMEATALQQMIRGQIAGMDLTQGFLLLAAISLEIPFVMIVLSRILPFKINKAFNIAASSMMILYQSGAFFLGTLPSLHYIFFSLIEIIGNAVILLITLKWINEESYV